MTDTGKPKIRQNLIAVVVAIVVIVFPLGYSMVSHVAADPADDAPLFLERPDAKYKECVKDTEYMRNHHWELLRGVREEIVRYGKRGDIALATCRDCHTSRERFCDRCHHATSLTPDCFECHYYP
jgi:hypothetical protein